MKLVVIISTRGRDPHHARVETTKYDKCIYVACIIFYLYLSNLLLGVIIRNKNSPVHHQCVITISIGSIGSKLRNFTGCFLLI